MSLAIASKLKWENRPDGAYLTVDPSLAGADGLFVEVRKILLREKVVNLDMGRISEVAQRASGSSERVGSPFRRFNEEKYRHISLSCTPMAAMLRIYGTASATGLYVTLEDLEFLLAERGVVFGINRDLLQTILEQEFWDQDHLVARGLSPVAGKDAQVEEVIAIDPDARPLIQSDGSVDYRHLETIRKISEGDLIAVRVPPTPGTPGMTIFGVQLDPEPGKDIRLPGGDNTQVSEDNLKLISRMSGYLYRRGPLICVGNLFVVRGDVNYKTGNIDYTGEILVTGNVLSDFRVEADGSITVEGAVEGAVVHSRNGTVTIRGGVFGKYRGSIEAKEDVQLALAQECSIQAGKTVRVERYLRGCTVDTTALKADGRGCMVSDCEIHFRDKVECWLLGSKTGGHNRIVLIDLLGDELHTKAEELAVACAKLKRLLGEMDTRIRTMKILMRQAEAVGGEAKAQYQQLTAQQDATKAKLDLLQARYQKVLGMLEVPPDRPDLVICEELQPVLDLVALGQEKSFRDSLSRLKLGWKNGALVAQPN